MKIILLVVTVVVLACGIWFGLIDRKYYYRIHWRGSVVESSFSVYSWPMTTKLLNYFNLRRVDAGPLRVYLDKPIIDSELIAEQAIVYTDSISRTSGKCDAVIFNAYCELYGHGRHWSIRVGKDGEYIVKFVDGTTFDGLDDIYVH